MKIIEHFPTDAKVKSELVRLIFGKRVRCPVCHTKRIRRIESRYWCPFCRKKFSLTSFSWLSNMKIPWRTLWLLILCWQSKLSPTQTCRFTHLSKTSVISWYRKFRINLPKGKSIVAGMVEVDEAFFGKQRFNNQTIVIGARNRDEKQVVLKIIPNREQATMESFIYKHVPKKSFLFTDSHSGYSEIGWFDYIHFPVNHSEGEFKETNLIENTWSVIKRMNRKVNDHIRKENLPLYLKEWEQRINRKCLFENPYTYLENTIRLVPTR